MEFLNPGILWGALAVGLPVLLHFWHQKRGEELPWAASRWLSDVVLQKSRGMRLENLLLLLLRCLLLILLVLCLSEPLLKRVADKQEKIHWIQPKKEVVENFRFELEEAGKRGEKRFWFTGEPVTDLASLPDGKHTDLQAGINKVKITGKTEIYLAGTDDFTRFIQVYLPAPYTLHTVKPVSGQPGGERLNTGIKERELPVKVLLESGEESTPAALRAITEAYGIRFEVDDQRRPGRVYDLAFTHRPDSSARVNLVSGAAALPVEQTVTGRTVRWFNELLNPESSDAVFNGELPEIILDALMPQAPAETLSTQQLRNKFAERQASQAGGPFPAVILILFVLTLSAERWLAIQKNA